MNYHALSRRELQALCKQHKIPANKTNVFMADSLTALLDDADSVEPAEVDILVEVAPVAPSEESVGEVVMYSDDAEESIVEKKTRGRTTKKTAVALVVPGVQDICSAVKPAAKRIAGRGKVASLLSLSVVENCANPEAPYEKTEPAGRSSRDLQKPAINSRNARALVKAATAPDSPGSDSAASSVTREEDEPVDIAVLAVLDSMKDAFAVQGGSSLGPEQGTPSPGGVFWFTKAPGHVEAMIKSGINGPVAKTIQDAGIEKEMLPEVVDVELPEDDVSKSMSALTLVDEVVAVAPPKEIENHPTTVSRAGSAAEVNAILQSEAVESETVVEAGEVPKAAPKRGGRGKKAAPRAPLPVDSEAPASVAEEVPVNHNDVTETEDVTMEPQREEADEAKPVTKKGRKAKKVAKKVAISPVDIEAAVAIVDDVLMIDNENIAIDVNPVEPPAKAEGPKPVTKKGRRGKKGACAVHPPAEIEVPAAVVKETELGSGNRTFDVLKSDEPLPEGADKLKPVAKKGRKSKKGTRAAHHQVDAEAPEAEAEDIQHDDRGKASLDLGNTAAVDEVQEWGIEETKATQKVGGKKKGLKAIGEKVNSPSLDVYVDIDFAKKAAVVETAAVQQVASECNDTPNHDASTSPVKSPSLAHMEDNSSSPVQSPSFAHIVDDVSSQVHSRSLAQRAGGTNTPMRSPSLAYMGNESDCESYYEGIDPLGNSRLACFKQGFASNKYGEDEVDKENSLRKQDITELPKSLRKLRKQVKEAIIKNKEKCSPLTDISLNLRSPRTLQSPSFSFQI